MNRHQLAISIKPDASEPNMQGVAGALRKKQNGPTQVLMSRRIATKVSAYDTVHEYDLRLSGHCPKRRRTLFITVPFAF